MKKFYFVIQLFSSLLIAFNEHTVAQQTSGQILPISQDSNEVYKLIETAGMYRFSKPDTSIVIASKALSLARQINFDKGEAMALITLGEDYRLGGDFPKALESLFQALKIARDLANEEVEARGMDFIGIAYVDLREARQGLHYLFQAKKINEKLSNKVMHCFGLSNIGSAYEKLNMLDSALFYQEQALQLQTNIISPDFSTNPLRSLILRQLGNIQNRMGNYSKALDYYRQVIRNNDLLNIGNSQYRIAEYFFNIQHNPDSSLSYALPAFKNNNKSFQKAFALDASTLLAKIYKAKTKFDSAYYYHEIAMELKDTLWGPEKFQKLQLLAIQEQQQQQELQQEKERIKTRIKVSVLLSAAGLSLLLAFLFYRNIRQKKKANALLQIQKEKIEHTLSELKSTQSLLIQSEKMASLGELTAGIAHEIQNPLNFVNNFSEVNKELLEELKNEKRKTKSERDENLEEELIENIRENEEKINHHGKRADAIVKGMLQHSRISSGVKEQTDINALCDEYLRLSYHGLRAKDKSLSAGQTVFNATMIPIAIGTDFDDTIGNINIIPQDIGRAVLNLINNAFYAVYEKKKQQTARPDDPVGRGYEPMVSVSTKKAGDKVLISVKDNGNGIPPKVVDKIFQPFFTTKPTGQGTGLGLSLSYDIVKAHGGELKVETIEGEGSVFNIQIPIN